MDVGIGEGAAVNARIVCALIAAVAAGSGCSSKSAAPAPAKPIIVLAHNDWMSANLNDAVAQILLKEQLGYEVQLVNAGTSDQWPKVAAGTLHASLEVWPSGHPDAIQKYVVADKTVESGGPIGVVARVGWFFPTYLLTAHPELATWKGLQNPAVVDLFKVSPTDDKARFVGGSKDWVQWDQQIIDNLKLEFKVEFAGSEEAEIALLDTVYPDRKPILFYLWEPHWVLAKYDLTLMELPPYSDACWAKGASNGIDCGYPPDNLFKIIWPGLKTLAPDAYQFFKNFSYTSKDDQVQMMGDVKGGMPIEAAARKWINTHPAVWKNWIPATTK